MRNKEEIRLNLVDIRKEAALLMTHMTILIDILDKVETEEDGRRYDEIATKLTKFKHIEVL